jgi:nucleotide-binding universal stress UspA family protein
MFKRILIAVNKSEPAEHAAETGIELAAELGASVQLVHVVAPPSSLATEFGVIDECAYDAPLREAEQLMNHLRSRVPAHVPCEHCVRQGDVADEILAAARLWRPDLIVVGSHGRGRLATLLLGSTAEDLVRRASCPVIVVRRTMHEIAPGVEIPTEKPSRRFFDTPSTAERFERSSIHR